MRATRGQESRQEVQASRHGRKFITQIKFRHSKNHLFYLIFYRKNAFKTLSPERKFQKRFIIDKYKNILYDNTKGIFLLKNRGMQFPDWLIKFVWEGDL